MPLIFKRLFSEHPTLLLTLSYLLITLIGVLYSYFFYQHFDMNILKFADLSDFLLISILEPRSVGVFLLILVFMFFVISVDYAYRKRFKRYGDFVKNKLKSKYSDPIIAIVLVIIIAPPLLHSLAFSNANDIKNGEVDLYEVRLSDAGEHAAVQNLVVLGTSSRYGYFYHPKDKVSFVVPLESISYMRMAKTDKVPLEVKTKSTLEK